MATLDYALLAEYARIDPNGLVTVVGGSFDRVRAPGSGAVQSSYLVIRLLLDDDEQSVSFTVRLDPPDGEYSVQVEGSVEKNELARPVAGKVSITGVVVLPVQVTTAGLYVIRLTLQDGQEREIPFVVELA